MAHGRLALVTPLFPVDVLKVDDSKQPQQQNKTEGHAE
jgi:hypothetical protein